jgi:hypothetical protein
MSKHGVTDGQIASSEVGEFEYQSTKAATPPPWEGALLAELSRAFGSRVYWSPGKGLKGARDKGYWHVLAHKPQLEMIQYAFDVLRRQLVAARAAHVAALPSYLTRPRKAAEGDAFGMGFIRALSAKIVTYADQDQRITDALKAKIDERCGKRQLAYKENRASASSAQAGAAAGATVSLHRATSGREELKALGG